MKKSFATLSILAVAMGCAKSKRITSVQPPFEKLRIEFVSGESVWALPADCRAELGNTATFIETQVKDNCLASKTDNHVSVFFCDGTEEMKVKHKHEPKFRYFPARTSCVFLLQALGYVFVESSPPSANIAVDNVDAGKAPQWIHLTPGTHSIQCSTSQDMFEPISIRSGDSLHAVCERQNQEASTMRSDDLTKEEKAGGVLMYIGAALISLAAVVLPFFFLF